MAKEEKNKHKKTIISLVSLLLFFGLIMIANASLPEAQNKFQNQLFFLKKQITWLGLSFLVFVFVQKIPINLVKKTAPLLYWITIFLLFLLLLPGFSEETLGAKRWLKIGPLSFQPAELAKLALILYLPQKLIKGPPQQSLIRLGTTILPILFLVLLEPDMGTAAVICGLGLSIYFLSGAKLGQLAVITSLISLLGLLLIFISPYRQSRLKSLIDPNRDPTGQSYHAYQITLGLGLGGLFGQGLGNSQQKQYLPEITTDSLLAIAAEEFGFVGITLFLFVFLALISQIFRLAQKAPDLYSQISIAAYASLLAFQGLVNLGSIAIIIPLTGVPFPFVSYGGSSLLILLTGLGLMFNLSK